MTRSDDFPIKPAAPEQLSMRTATSMRVKICRRLPNPALASGQTEEQQGAEEINLDSPQSSKISHQRLFGLHQLLRTNCHALQQHQPRHRDLPTCWSDHVQQFRGHHPSFLRLTDPSMMLVLSPVLTFCHPHGASSNCHQEAGSRREQEERAGGRAR
eukprot:751696-Hanusia_phi.AAC.1